MEEYTHPHFDPRHVMVTYRKFILGNKKRLMLAGKGRTAHRSHMWYSRYVQEYLVAKRFALEFPENTTCVRNLKTALSRSARKK